LTFLIAPRPQLRELVAADVRNLILNGEVRPGTLLRIGAIAERVQTSATPVREALLLLASEGWVAQEPNRGFKVAQLRLRDLQDLRNLRAHILSELAARCAEAGPETLAPHLRQIDEELRRTAELRRKEDLNYEFHDLINTEADAPRLRLVAESLRAYARGIGISALPGWADLHDGERHCRIVDAIERRDKDAAREEMTLHVVEVDLLIEERLRSLGVAT
jgi:DNA-binding GntR family transcriptional regulator